MSERSQGFLLMVELRLVVTVWHYCVSVHGYIASSRV